jgi:hypothetical protein
MESGVWLEITAQFGPSVMMPCPDEFATHKTAIFLVIYSKLHHRDISVLVNKNAGLWFYYQFIISAQ